MPCFPGLPSPPLPPGVAESNAPNRAPTVVLQRFNTFLEPPSQRFFPSAFLSHFPSFSRTTYLFRFLTPPIIYAVFLPLFSALFYMAAFLLSLFPSFPLFFALFGLFLAVFGGVFSVFSGDFRPGKQTGDSIGKHWVLRVFSGNFQNVRFLVFIPLKGAAPPLPLWLPTSNRN